MRQPTIERVLDLWSPFRSAAEMRVQRGFHWIKAVRGHADPETGQFWKPLPDLTGDQEHRLISMIDNFTDAERVEMLHTLGRTVLAFHETQDVQFLTQLARQVHVTMTLRNSDEHVKELRDQPHEAAPAEKAVSISDLMARLA